MRRSRTSRQSIRSAGYFRQKARRFKLFVAFLDERSRWLSDRMFRQTHGGTPRRTPGTEGVGPETADSILLYAGQHPVFVVDAYTRRILERHGTPREKTTYEEIRQLFDERCSP